MFSRRASAVSALQQALADCPDGSALRPNIAYNLAVVLAEQGEGQQALHTLRSALAELQQLPAAAAAAPAATAQHADLAAHCLILMAVLLSAQRNKLSAAETTLSALQQPGAVVGLPTTLQSYLTPEARAILARVQSELRRLQGDGLGAAKALAAAQQELPAAAAGATHQLRYVCNQKHSAIMCMTSWLESGWQ